MKPVTHGPLVGHDCKEAGCDLPRRSRADAAEPGRPLLARCLCTYVYTSASAIAREEPCADCGHPLVECDGTYRARMARWGVVVPPPSLPTPNTRPAAASTSVVVDQESALVLLDRARRSLEREGSVA